MKRLFSFLFVVLVLVLGVGYYQGWFSFDKGKFKEDVAKAKSKLTSLSKTVVDKVKGLVKKTGDKESQLEGKISGVADGKVTVDVAGQEVPLDIGEGVVLTMDGKNVGVSELAKGAKVKVTFEQDADSMVVRKIEASK